MRLAREATEATRRGGGTELIHSETPGIVFLNAGWVATRAGEIGLAWEWLDTALQITHRLGADRFPLHVAVMGARIDLLLAQGDIAKARQLSRQRVSYLKTVAAVDPHLSEAFEHLDRAHEIRQAAGADYQEVAWQMGRCVEALQPFLGRNDRKLVQIQMERAQALIIEQGKWATVRHLLTESMPPCRLARFSSETIWLGPRVYSVLRWLREGTWRKPRPSCWKAWPSGKRMQAPKAMGTASPSRTFARSCAVRSGTILCAAESWSGLLPPTLQHPPGRLQDSVGEDPQVDPETDTLVDADVRQDHQEALGEPEMDQTAVPQNDSRE